MNTRHLLIIATAAAVLPSCATKREVPFRPWPGAPFTGQMARYDYSSYAHIPDTPTSAVYRAVLKAIPYTRHRAFWGNWAGSGNKSGPPIDAMDEVFRRHDIVYAESRTLRTMSWSDAACVEALHGLDARKMSPQALAFRDRSASFFSNPNLKLVGKPVSSYFLRRESAGCPFKTEDDVRRLFGLEPKAKSRTSAAVPAERLTGPARAVAAARRTASALRLRLAAR